MAGSGHTKRQWITILVFSVAQFCNAIVVSLQAPFFPYVAEAKGVSATQYGLVFGVFELVVFLVSPIYGKFMHRLGVRFVNNAGIFVVSIMCVLFGFLNHVSDSKVFIGLAFAIRIVEALGNAAFITSAFSIIAKEFPHNVGGAFSIMETFFGLGLIVGPSVGGALYELQGYSLPFVSMGIFLLCAATVVHCFLPFEDDDTPKAIISVRVCQVLMAPEVAISVFTTVAASISIGFLQATLEPHLRPLGLSPFQTGLMFVVNGGIYAATAPFWGWLTDKKVDPRKAMTLGAFVVSLAFVLVGPAPFLPISLTVSSCIVALVIHGLGFAAELVSTFSALHKDSLILGFPDDLSTYSLVSGLWTSAFAFGAFVGPSAAGFLYDTVGFRWASVTVTFLHLLIGVAVSLYVSFSRRPDVFSRQTSYGAC